MRFFAIFAIFAVVREVEPFVHLHGVPVLVDDALDRIAFVVGLRLRERRIRAGVAVGGAAVGFIIGLGLIVVGFVRARGGEGIAVVAA